MSAKCRLFKSQFAKAMSGLPATAPHVVEAKCGGDLSKPATQMGQQAFQSSAAYQTLTMRLKAKEL